MAASYDRRETIPLKTAYRRYRNFPSSTRLVVPEIGDFEPAFRRFVLTEITMRTRCAFYQEDECMKNSQPIGAVRITNVGDAQMRLKVVRRLLRDRGVIVTQARLAELAISALDVDVAAALLADRKAVA